MDHNATATPPALPHRTYVPRRVLANFSTPVLRVRASPQQEWEIAGLLARTVACRREPFGTHMAAPVAACIPG